jgi:hypothetical protein
LNVVTTVSCTAPGDCTAGGDYVPALNTPYVMYRPFVVTESGGTWGTAQEVPGVAAQPAADPATIAQVSCSAPGNCVAVGNYSGAPGDNTGKGGASAEGFTVTQTNGRWGEIQLVPHISPEPGVNILLSSVSCAPGSAQAPRLDCVAVGGGFDVGAEAVTLHYVNGAWRWPGEVPGLAAISAQPVDNDLRSVSCSSPGNCAATGYYTDKADLSEAFIVTEEHGRWGTAWPVAGAGSLARPYQGWGLSVACPADGSCTATGDYDASPDSEYRQSYVASEKAGAWKAVPLSGFTGPALNDGANDELAAVACSGPGNCAVDGSLTTTVAPTIAATDSESYVATESGGSWGPAQLLAGGADVTLVAMSCPAVGECTAGGTQTAASGKPVPIVISERNGHWGSLFPLAGGPFTGTKSAMDAGFVYAISCATPATCVAVGQASSVHVPGQGFTAAMTRTNPAG